MQDTRDQAIKEVARQQGGTFVRDPQSADRFASLVNERQAALIQDRIGRVTSAAGEQTQDSQDSNPIKNRLGLEDRVKSSDANQDSLNPGKR